MCGREHPKIKRVSPSCLTKISTLKYAMLPISENMNRLTTCLLLILVVLATRMLPASQKERGKAEKNLALNSKRLPSASVCEADEPEPDDPEPGQG